MARLTFNDKCIRVLLLLLGLRDPRIAAALSAHGFDAAQLAHGWHLLSQMSAGRLDQFPVAPDPRLVRELDAWENRWFPIIEVVLRTNFPDVREVIFRNLAQTEGPAVVVSVGTLLERLRKIVRTVEDGGLGEEGQRARDRLTARGLKPEVVAEAERLLAELRTIPPEIEEDDATDYEQAEKDLWSWYLEWSGIARSVIRERRLLRALGFLRRSSKKNSAEEEEDDDADS